jgi:magnesium-transporting ATPase (P-type)
MDAFRMPDDNKPVQHWHALDADAVLTALGTDSAKGLSQDEADRRISEHGANELKPAAGRSAWQRLLAQFNNLFIYLLLVAGVITAGLGEWVDSGVIFGVVVLIALIGFLQEGKAEKAMEAVRSMLSPRAWVLRDGHRRELDAALLVPGDIVLLDAGDRVPADIRLLRMRNLQIQEAALTGESTSSEKSVDAVEEEADLGDRHCIAFLGTLVTAGQGSGVVVATGDATEIGRISGLLSDIETLKTPLTRRLDAFAKTLSVAIVAFSAVTYAVGTLIWGREPADMFFVAVSIAVAAIPEGLPAVMTITLAIGVERMARRNAIVRRLPAVETLGSVTVVCSDKTGTLTKNEMTAKTIVLADREIAVEGVGYQPHGGFLVDDQAVDAEQETAALEVVRAALICNDAQLRHQDGEWIPEGDPTEAALIVLAHKAGLEPRIIHEELPRLDVIPFSSERRYMATLNHDHVHDNHYFIFVKGAPERVLEMCDSESCDGENRPLRGDWWRSRIDAIAERGQRVLAVARKDMETGVRELSEREAENGLTLLGLLGMIDPPREEAIAAVGACQSAGIRVKMITGDHALTAQAIAAELKLNGCDRVLTGRDIERLDDNELRERAHDTDVFARASPEHKLRLVKALQARGEVTAMTGDGVNDAPALKRADVGIAMGLKGTEAAREAAEMVLADDNFASIERAVEEGRTVYDNLKKAILFILPTNAAQALVIVAAVLLGWMLPVTPVQILWVNMITAITLGIAFAWEKPEGDLMKRPPRNVDEPLMTPFVIWRVAFVGVLLLVGAGGLYMLEEARAATSLEYARTMAVNALVMGQIFYLVSARFFVRSSLSVDGVLGNRVVVYAIVACVLLQLVFTYVPLMQYLFGTAPLQPDAWLRCVAVGASVFLLVEFEKWIVRRRQVRTAAV